MTALQRDRAVAKAIRLSEFVDKLVAGAGAAAVKYPAGKSCFAAYKTQAASAHAQVWAGAAAAHREVSR